MPKILTTEQEFLINNNYTCQINKTLGVEMEQIKAIYIHIPFCQTICSYCDFCKLFYNKKLVNLYLKELEKEIIANYKGEEISTIYIGGGTPTSLSYDELSFLFSIIKKIKLNNNYEFTIEANTDSLDINKIKLLKENGVTRVSIGVETFNSSYQKLINRKLSYKELENTIKLLKDNGITNINLDLMYGFKNKSIEILDKDLEHLLKLEVPHISIYSLIIENNTILKINNYQRLDDDNDQILYKYIEKKLEDNNYHHYEISNYAKDGYLSRHNLVYWNNDEYYGFGLSAASYYNNIRKTNTRSITNYLKGIKGIEIEELSLKDKMDYEIILGLRLEKGISKERFINRYNTTIDKVYNYKDLLDSNILIENDKYLYVNKKYRYVLNEILERIL